MFNINYYCCSKQASEEFVSLDRHLADEFVVSLEWTVVGLQYVCASARV